MGYHASIEQDEVTARRILDDAVLPAMLTGYDLSVGDFDGTPALFITFGTTLGEGTPVDELKHAGSTVNSFTRELRDILMRANPDRFPFFHFRSPQP